MRKKWKTNRKCGKGWKEMKGSEKGDEKERDESENGVKKVGKGRRDGAMEQGTREKGGKEAMEKGRKGERRKGRKEEKGGGEKGWLSETNVRVTKRQRLSSRVDRWNCLPYNFSSNSSSTSLSRDTHLLPSLMELLEIVDVQLDVKQ